MTWCVNTSLYITKALQCTLYIGCFFSLCPEDLHDKVPYNITVTPLLDDKTGYSTEALQICTRAGGRPYSHFCCFFPPMLYQPEFNNVFSPAPGKVNITDVQPYDKSVFVSWDTKSQDPCSGNVTHYIIFCEMETKQRQLSKFTLGL